MDDFDVFLELYSERLPDDFGNLPGAENVHDGDYWAVLIPTQSPGSFTSSFLAPEGPTANVQSISHGTDTLQDNASEIFEPQAGIWWPKSPPYSFIVVSPAGDQFVLNPPQGQNDNDDSWFFIPIQDPAVAGIWTIQVQNLEATANPLSINGRRATLNQELTDFDSSTFYRQPLLRIIGRNREDRPCPEWNPSIESSGCVPGTVNLIANVDTTDDIATIIWNFGAPSTNPANQPESVTYSGASVAQGLAPQSYTYAESSDISDGVAVSVTIVGTDPDCVATDTQLVSACPPADPDCASVSYYGLADGACAPGLVCFELLIEPLAEPLQISWDFGDGNVLNYWSDASNAANNLQLFLDQYLEADGFIRYCHNYQSNPPATGFETSITVTRNFNCNPPALQPVLLVVPGCNEPECAQLESVQIDNGCAPGTVQFSATISDVEQVQEINWDYGDGSADEFFNAADIAAGNGQVTTHDYADAGPYVAVVTIVRAAGCQPLVEDLQVAVPECPQPCAELGDVSVSGCAPGEVTVSVGLENANHAEEIVIDFGDGSQLTIDPASLPAGAEQIDVEHEYTEAGPHEIVVTILRGENCGDDGATLTQAGNIQVPAWLCPSNIAIVITNSNGIPVIFGAGICQPAGDYTATAIGTDLDGANLSWTLDGAFLGNGTSAGFTFNPADGLINGECCTVPTSNVSVTAGTGGDPEVCSNQQDCPPSSASATLTACRRDYLEKGWCSLLLKVGILVMVGIFAMMLAIMLCPAIVALPSITLPSWVIVAWEFIAVWIIILAPYIALIAAFIGVLLFGLWSFLCRPDRCFDITVIVWQALFVVGVIFIYFGMCPACIALWIIGIPIFLLSIAVFIGWLIACNPTPCKVFYEIGVLSIAQVIVGWLAIILGACIWDLRPMVYGSTTIHTVPCRIFRYGIRLPGAASECLSTTRPD